MTIKKVWKYCLIIVFAFMFNYSYAQSDTLSRHPDAQSHFTDTLPPPDMSRPSPAFPATPFIVGKIIIKGNRQRNPILSSGNCPSEREIPYFSRTW